VIAGRRKRGHDVSPAESKFGETVQQKNASPIVPLEPCFQDVHREAVTVVDEARANSRRQHLLAVGDARIVVGLDGPRRGLSSRARRSTQPEPGR
jgi:hypothetical protein